MCVGARRSQKRTLDPLKLKLEVVVKEALLSSLLSDGSVGSEAMSPSSETQLTMTNVLSKPL